MSQTTLFSEQARSTRGDEAPLARRRGRAAIVAVLILSLLASAATRYWSDQKREEAIPRRGETSPGSSLSSMNSFALGLLLGGLRGPLVMFLWTESESQKADKNLEGIDTQIEWIRLLQPEFDTVHIFQVWNKAYNVSVQMASLANKYATILDAIEYAQRVEAARPNNINMIYAVGGIYFDKLGTSTEKPYYSKRVREESMPHPTRQRLSKDDPGWRRVELDPVLDKNGMILPELLKPKYERPAKTTVGGDWNNGAELQYLEKYQPYPYGVNTFGFAYNYFKRAEVLQTATGQKHAQLSELVVDSRPALALKQWGESELERGRQFELRIFGRPLPEERNDLELPTADVAVDAPTSGKREEALAEMAAAIESYDRAAKLGPDALKEYERHLKGYGTNLATYQSHMDEVKATSALAAGDRDYLRAMLADGDARKKALATAAENYAKAAELTYRVMFKYYIDDELAAQAFPPGIRRTNVDELPSSLLDPVFVKIQTAAAKRQYDPSKEDRLLFEHYIERIKARQKRIAAAG